MIEIQTADPSDALEMRALYLDAFSPVAHRLGYRPSPMDRRFTEALSGNMVLKAVAADEKPLRAAGYAAVSPSAACLYVDAIAVDPRRRRLGVGAALLSAVEELAAELCYPQVELNTDPRLTEVVRFYRDLGFKEIERPRYVGALTVRFRKPVATKLDQLLGRATKDAQA